MGLIVNADDFGKDHRVNKAITECFNRGLINRTTVMVNMPGVYDAIELATKNGFIEHVGLHINLTEGTPISEPIKSNPYFCDSDGNYNAAFYHDIKLRLHMDEKSIFDIEQEIEAQLKVYGELGFNLYHLDSHHHAHTNFPVYKALKNLSGVYEFSSIRLSRNLYKDQNILKTTYKKYYNKKIGKICSNTTDYFGSFKDAATYFIYPNAQNSLQSFGEFCNKYDLEIMVHPMYTEDGILSDGDVPFEKEKELYEAFKEM